MKTLRPALRLSAFLISFPILLGSCSSSEMPMPKFRALKPFEGRVTKVERIAYESDYHLHSASGPDFRVTVVKDRGKTIVIERIHTQIFQDERLMKLVQREKCDLPDEIVQCEDRIGKNRY
jgi:hypothetical protein